MKTRRYLKWPYFAALLLFLIFISSTVKAMADISLSNSSVTLYLGEEQTFQFSVLEAPDGATVRFTSSNKEVATITSKIGKVTAIAPGKTTITCTVTDGNGVKTSCKATVYVRDNIKKITLKLSDTSVKRNALKKNTDYPLGYTCTTIAGTNQNTGNYLHYEVLDAKGKEAKYASVTEDGVFRATKTGAYTIEVYCFRKKSDYNTWSKNREKYASRVLAQDQMDVTVTLKNFSTVNKRLYSWKFVIPEGYAISSHNKSDDVITYTVNASNSEGTASNIQVRIDTVDQAPDFAELKKSILEVYTKDMISDSWKKLYNAKSVKVANLKRQVVTINGHEIMKISYNIILKNIVLKFENSADIKISQLTYYNTIYTWYDGTEHLTVNVTDAYESIQPNITEAAEKLVASLQRK